MLVGGKYLHCALRLETDRSVIRPNHRIEVCPRKCGWCRVHCYLILQSPAFDFELGARVVLGCFAKPVSRSNQSTARNLGTRKGTAGLSKWNLSSKLESHMIMSRTLMAVAAAAAIA